MHNGGEIKGRHEPLISEELFNRVQAVLESRSAAQERRRVHHHYLEGSLFCGRCNKKTGTKRRMIIQHTINAKGYEYTYFFCRNKQKGACNAPHINVLLVEDTVERHYATVQFSRAFITDIRAHLAKTLWKKRTPPPSSCTTNSKPNADDSTPEKNASPTTNSSTVSRSSKRA